MNIFLSANTFTGDAAYSPEVEHPGSVNVLDAMVILIIRLCCRKRHTRTHGES